MIVFPDFRPNNTPFGDTMATLLSELLHESEGVGAPGVGGTIALS
jgi:hypothetical protein